MTLSTKIHFAANVSCMIKYSILGSFLIVFVVRKTINTVILAIDFSR